MSVACSFAVAPAAQADPFDLLPPTASITATPNPAETSQFVTFDGSGSWDIDGTITRYEWDLDGDGGYETDTAADPAVSTQYFSPGVVTVKLRVSDTGEPAPNTDEAQVTVTIQAPPSASFTISPSSPETGETITLTSTSSDEDGSIASEQWDLDNDGSFDATGPTATTSFATPGSYQIRLRVTDNDGLTSDLTDSVLVSNRDPTASFDFSPVAPLSGQNVTFTSTASDPDGSIDSYAWDLDGDGSFDNGSGSTASRSFSTPGPKTVKLRVTDDNGATAIAQQVVNVGNRAPAASFGYSPASPLTAQTITFTSTSSDPDGTIADQAWDLDNDGQFNDATGQTATRSFSIAGTYHVRLLVTDGNGDTAVATDNVTVSSRTPTASFDFSPTSPLSGQTVTFTSTSSDSDGSITGYAWDLNNDGAFDDGNGSTATTSFSTPGAHQVRLRVTDNDGLTADATDSVTVSNQDPTASFNFSPTSPLSGQSVTFTSTSSDPDGTIAGYAWDLDNDGVYDDSTSSVATRSFPTPGARTVRLRVTDNNGGTATTQAVVNVGNRAPTAEFNYSPSIFQTFENVTFTSTSSDQDGSIASHEWDFGNDGVFEQSGSSVTHQFATAGNHVVTLRVTDNSGDSASVQQTVSTGNRSPSASFTTSPPSPLTLQTVTFTSTSTDQDGTIAGHAWDLDDDGQFDDANGATATRSFPTAGTYQIRLRVTDNDGGTAVATDSVSVANRAPTASFDFSPASPLSGQSITFTSSSSDPDGALQSQAWDLDNDNQFDDATGASAVWSFATAGSKTVRLQVVDADGVPAVATRSVPVGNRPPTASFTIVPESPLSGQTVTFTSTSSDPEGQSVTQAWDLDNDGTFDDGTGVSASRSFPAPGPKTVSLRVVDASGAPSTTSNTFVVANRSPEAAFSHSPATPLTAQPVTFTSTSTDPDGTIANWQWDLDNDGQFDDASGATATRSFPAAGTYQVRLLVTDNSGGVSIATDSVSVTNRRPTAAFGFSPASPLSGQQVTFTSSSSDPEGALQSQAWDLDNDGEFDDATSASAVWTFATPGSKTVSLWVIDAEGDSDVATRTVPVENRDPVASFTVSPATPVSGQSVTFTSTSSDPDGSIAAYAWDLDGDGAYDDSTSSVATRSFPTPGARTVRLRVTDDTGAAAIAQAVVNVTNQAPTATFGYSPETFQTLQNVTFTSTASDPDGSIVSHQWDFNNDGTFEASGASVSHQFATPGLYVVTLRVTDNSGTSTLTQKTVSPGNRPPSPSFTVSPTSPRVLQPVTFTSTSTDPDGTVARHDWDLDNNGSFETPGSTVSRSFNVPGTYSVRLQVTDNGGVTNVLSKGVVVVNQAPTVTTISTSPASPMTLEPVTFSSNASDPEGLPLTITWDLADTVASGPMPAREFPTPGPYTITVHVVDSFGASATFTRTVQIANRPPMAAFVHSPTTPNPFETVTFNASTSGDRDGTIAKYEWDTDNDGLFDDDTADGLIDQSATRKFNESGSFTVRLKVTDDTGASTIASQTVFVGNQPPIASFGYSPAQPTAGQAVTFYSTASDPDSPITGYAWDLDGNGSYDDAAGTTATRAFPAGSYVVGLRVTDSEGATGFVSQAINVSVPPPPAARQATVSGPRLMSPFPLVRISGTITRRGSRLQRLTVTAPPGATVLVRCRGRTCPFGRQSRVIKSASQPGGRQPTAMVVRIKRFERKLLRSGTLIRIFVTKPGVIGKYTRFKIRARTAPARIDSCLAPASTKPMNCPSL